jgi:hypothetical protein
MTNRSATLERDATVPEPKPKLGPEHKHLGAFAGAWTAEGVTAASASAAAEKMAHEHTYEWLAGGFFLLHRWDGHIGAHASKGIEIIGYDPSSQAYEVHFFDSDGWSRIYQGSVRERTWAFTGSRERYTVTFANDGKTMTIHWDQLRDGGEWQPLCDVTATRKH